MRILALESGRVVNVEKVPTYGIVVTVEAKRKNIRVKYEIKYCFLDWAGVKVGDIVTPGQLIGTIPDGHWWEEEEEG